MKKISFIIYYEEERALQECIYYIKRLQAPVGFEIDFFCVKNAESMETVRKAAAENGCTEYQVYLDQNVLIINNFFLYEVLSRLQKETEPVVLGVWGNAVDKSNRGRLLLWTETGIEEAACVCGRADTEAAD